MKAFLLLAALCSVTLATAQNVPAGSPAGMSSTTRMIEASIAKSRAALKAGKTVTITVDNRTVAFAPKLIGTMVFIPVRFFTETGQKIVWDKSDRRATVTEENGTRKNSVEFDGSVSQSNRRPGPSMRPIYQKGTLYVPLSAGLASFGLVAEWVSTSNRINVRTNRPAQ